MAPRRRWLRVHALVSLFAVCLWAHAALALVRIPLQRPSSPQRPLRLHHGAQRHHHHHHSHHGRQHPLAMMQSQQEGHYDRVAPLSHVALQNVDDYLYSATVALGSPRQNFTVLLDTGSTDAWVPGQRCATCGSAHHQFDRRRSRSFADLHEPFDGEYGSGASRGDVVRDALWVGDHEIPEFVFALITSETGDIPSFPTDGVLGLAFRGMSKIADRRLPTLLDALLASSSSPTSSLAPVFAFQLTTLDDATPSEFHFGGIDLACIGAQPQLAFFPVLKLPVDTELTYWTIALQSFRVMDDAEDAASLLHQPTPRHKQALCAPFCYAIVDSGTSLIYAPEQIYDSVIARIMRHQRGCDRATLLCRDATRNKFPSLVFSFGAGDVDDRDPPIDNVFVLRPESYVTCDGKDGTTGVCSVNILNHAEMGDDLFWWVLGDTFLQAYYTVFDVGQRRVGLACDGASSNCAISARATP